MRQPIANAIRKYGEPLTVTPRAGLPYSFTGSVQRPELDPLVGDVDEDTFTVYVFPDDVPQVPAKFDRILLRGKSRNIDDVRTETIEGQLLVHILRVQG